MKPLPKGNVLGSEPGQGRTRSRPTLVKGRLVPVYRREGLADLVVADTLLGPEQAAARLRVRCADLDHMVRLGWVRSP